MGAIDLTKIDEKSRTKQCLNYVLRIPSVTWALPHCMKFPQSQYPLAFLLVLSKSVNHVMLVNIDFWTLVNVRTHKAITEDKF